MTGFHMWAAVTYLLSVAAIYEAVTLQPGCFYTAGILACVAAEITMRAWDRAA